MTLDSKYTYRVLCEDKQTQCYLRYFLEYNNINSRKVFFAKLPANGCGEQYVREQFSLELKRLRSSNYVSKVLVVCVDADKLTHDKRLAQLGEECTEDNVPPQGEGELILCFVPKRNIETWIEYYDTPQEKRGTVEENTDYGHNRGHEANCKPAVCKMAEEFKQQSSSFGLSSLQFAFEEYKRVCELQ